MTEIDYSATPLAHRQRLDKARAIGDLAWTLGLAPEDLLHGLDDAAWNGLARRATDGKPASDETKRLAYCHLSLREAWAAGWPDDPRAHRTIRPVEEVAAELATRRKARNAH